MQKLIIIFALSIVSIALKGQNKLAFYKKRADIAISEHFSSSLKPQVIQFEIKSQDNKRMFSKYYDSFKEEIVFPSYVRFEYSGYSQSLSNGFSFSIILNKDGLVDSAFYNLPKCIFTGSQCPFISKDSAVKIALTDSIQVQNGIFAEFKSNFSNTKFYWVITGYSREGKTKLTATSAILNSQIRLINATTGRICQDLE